MANQDIINRVRLLGYNVTDDGVLLDERLLRPENELLMRKLAGSLKGIDVELYKRANLKRRPSSSAVASGEAQPEELAYRDVPVYIDANLKKHQQSLLWSIAYNDNVLERDYHSHVVFNASLPFYQTMPLTYNIVPLKVDKIHIRIEKNFDAKQIPCTIATTNVHHKNSQPVIHEMILEGDKDVEFILGNYISDVAPIRIGKLDVLGEATVIPGFNMEMKRSLKDRSVQIYGRP